MSFALLRILGAAVAHHPVPSRPGTALMNSSVAKPPFSSGGVARPTLTLRHSNTASSNVCLAGRKKRLFAAGIFMRAAPELFAQSFLGEADVLDCFGLPFSLFDCESTEAASDCVFSAYLSF